MHTNDPRSPDADLAGHWSLDPDVTFLNHGSFGACPTAVLDYQSELRARLEREPVRFYVRELQDLLDETRATIAEFVGAPPEQVVHVQNATTGVNTVLKSLEFSPGDEIVVTDHEYGACRNTVDLVADRSGATVRVVELPFPLDDPSDVVDAIADAFTDATRLLLVDHVTSQTGLVLPIEEIVDAAHERGVETLVDGAHAPGMVPLRVAELAPTYYTGNFHKWVCSPKSAAFLYVDSKRIGDIRPLVTSHGATRGESELERFHYEFDWTGTTDPTAYLCVPKAIEHMASMVDGGWPAIYTRNHELAVFGRRILADALGVEPPAPAAMLGSLAALPLPDGDPDPQPTPLYLDPDQDRFLFEHDIEVPIIPWPEPPSRLIRVSAQLYNSEADYRRLADVLPSVVLRDR